MFVSKNAISSGLSAVPAALADFAGTGNDGMGAGALAAFSSTLVSMRLIRMLERSSSLLPYVAYRTALGTAALLALRKRARARLEVQPSLNGHRSPARVTTVVQ